MKQAIQFGAGNIGRGFMGAILERGGWHVTFADVVDSIVDGINTNKHYTVHILDQECYDWEITNISAVKSTGPMIAPAIARCDLITTAVGPLVLPKIAVTIAEGIRVRIAAGNTEPMNIICCENGLRTTTKLKNETFQHLSPEEIALTRRAAEIINRQVAVACTGCSYCTDGCPMQLAIPKYFSLYNEDMREDLAHKGWTANYANYAKLTADHGRAGDCIGCGQCEGVCPQHLPIISLMRQVSAHYDG